MSKSNEKTNYIIIYFAIVSLMQGCDDRPSSISPGIYLHKNINGAYDILVDRTIMSGQENAPEGGAILVGDVKQFGIIPSLAIAGQCAGGLSNGIQWFTIDLRQKSADTDVFFYDNKNAFEENFRKLFAHSVPSFKKPEAMR